MPDQPEELGGDAVTILLVEDDDIDARIVKRSLRQNNVANPIDRVVNGLEALAYLRQRTDDEPTAGILVLLDLNMPQMTGHEFLSELRRDPALEKTVVFVLTTSTDPVDLDRAYERHVAGYLVKTDVGEDLLRIGSFVDKYVVTVQLPVPCSEHERSAGT